MSQAISIISKSRKSVLLGTSALDCLALAAPVLADDYTVSSNSTLQNGGNTIGGGDTLTLQEGVTLNVAGDAIFSSGGPRVEVFGDVISGEDGV